MVRIDKNSPSPQPHNVNPAKGSHHAVEPARMKSVADKISGVAPHNISSAGKHTITLKVPNKSEAKDINHVASQALKLIKQLNKR